MAAFGKFDGFYSRVQGLQRRYGYSATYATTDSTIEWRASVFFDSQVKGTPGGLLFLPEEITDIHGFIRQAVELAIEGLIDVTE